MFKKSRLRRPFAKRDGKQPNHCWNLHDSTFMTFIDNCKDNWVGKKDLLVTCKILGLSVNKLTADDKYSLVYKGNLT